MKHAAALALVLVLIFTAWSAGAETLLRPGLRLDYVMEQISEGTSSEERLSLGVLDEVGEGRWHLELVLGDDAARYRALYDASGTGPHFATRRFEAVEEWMDGWQPVDPEQLEIINALGEIESLLTGSSWDAESTLVVGERDFPCRRYAIEDSTRKVQVGESVTLTQTTRREGEAWISADIPFGGWVRYHERRHSRKSSEFAGRRFDGEEDHAIETWTLDAFTLGD